MTGCLLLAGCEQDNGMQEAPASHAAAASQGSFTGTVGGQEYEVTVDCFHLDKDWFTFLSDRDDVTDSNGDGLNISGMQNGDRFVLTVIDHGEKHSTGKLASFTKSATGAQGAGSLTLDGSPQTLEAYFSVSCK